MPHMTSPDRREEDPGIIVAVRFVWESSGRFE